jgi:transposase
MCLYVDQISISEGRKLQSILRRDCNRIKVRRAQVILASAQGSKVPDIARRLYFSPQHIRTIIKEFNANGFVALEAKYCGGRPREFTAEQRSLIIETALCPPDLLGRPFKRWSLEKLREFVIEQRIVDSISIDASLRIGWIMRVWAWGRGRVWREVISAACQGLGGAD